MSDPAGPLDLTATPSRGDHVRGREIDGEAVLLDERSGELHVLNPPAAVVWNCLDGASSLAEIAADIASVTGEPQEQVEVDVLQAVEAFATSGLLAGSPAPERDEPPETPPPNT